MKPIVHKSFKLNNRSLNKEGLMEVAYSYVKEGAPWEKEIGDFLLNWLDDFNVLTVTTSGSTGVPKELKLDKKHMIHSAHITSEALDLPAGTIALCCLPLNYIAGKMMFIRAIELGWNLDIVKPSTQPLHKADKRYDFTAMTPHQVRESLDYIYKTRQVLIGGAAISKALIKALNHKHTKATASYGMTETASHIALREIYPQYEEYFKPVKDVKITLDENDCLIATAPWFTQSPIETTDIIELNENGSFKLLGRLSEVINSGGLKIHPADIENELSKKIKDRFFISAVPDEKLGEKVALIVENQQAYEISLHKLDSHHKPKITVFTKSFAETKTGKVDKTKTLQELIKSGEIE